MKGDYPKKILKSINANNDRYINQNGIRLKQGKIIQNFRMTIRRMSIFSEKHMLFNYPPAK